jgi:hypothetical protein
LEDLAVNGRAVLKWISKERGGTCKRGYVWLGTGILESSEEVSNSSELCSASFEQSNITKEISNRNMNFIAVIIFEILKNWEYNSTRCTTGRIQ